MTAPARKPTRAPATLPPRSEGEYLTPPERLERATKHILSGSIVAFSVPGRPVPWSVPVVFRNGGCKRDGRLVSWQEEIRLRARQAMGRREPFDGLVEIHLIATVAPPRDRRYRDPDCTNLLKGIEDALQGIVIVNDRQVCRQFVERVRGEQEGAYIGVWAV